MNFKKNSFNILVVSLLILILFTNLLSLLKKDSSLYLETLKVWWKENLESIKKIYWSDSYITQQTMSIQQALAQINWDNAQNNSNNPQIQNNVNILDEFQKIKSSAIVYGKEDARFTIIEYSEFLCPFCKRHSDQWTLRQVVETYPSEVNKIFRNFIVYSDSSKLAEVVECVWEIKSDYYFNFIKDTFAYEWRLSVEILLDIASKLWINKNKLKDCVDSWKHTQEVNNQTNEWRNLFGVSGTPWNVIIDTETWEFVLIPWAYPKEKFIEEIEKLKNN